MQHFITIPNLYKQLCHILLHPLNKRMIDPQSIPSSPYSTVLSTKGIGPFLISPLILFTFSLSSPRRRPRNYGVGYAKTSCLSLNKTHVSTYLQVSSGNHGYPNSCCLHKFKLLFQSDHELPAGLLMAVCGHSYSESETGILHEPRSYRVAGETEQDLHLINKSNNKLCDL